MGVSKVVINNDGVENVLVDITDSTVTPETLAEGETAYGANGEKITGTMKAGSDPVQSDWLQNDPSAPDYIKNKPFGGGGNSVSWASAGIDFNSLPPDTWVKVSNAVVTMEDFADVTENDRFFTWVAHGEEYSLLQSDESVNNPLNLIQDLGNGTVVIWVIDMMGNSYYGVEFRPDGVYFFTGFDDGYRAYPVSVTIPGFGKFESATTIDSKYLPEGLQTETISLTDTITIDRVIDDNWNIDVAKVVGMKWIGDARMVSDANIPVKSCYNNGFGYTLGQGQKEDGVFTLDAEEIANGFYHILMTDENGNTFPGGYCATDGCGYDTGLYLNEWGDASFTFLYGAIFETRTPKPIDKKYLPDDLGGMPEVTEADNGKFLRVVDGAWSAVAVPNAEGVGF